MAFFSTLKDLASNKKEFRQWEEKHDDIDAKRAAIYQKKHFTPEEIAQAKKLGQTITDVVDIMDQHSEDISEDVEAGTQPIVGLAPFIALGGTGFAGYKFYLKDKFKNYQKNVDAIIKKYDLENYLNQLNKNGAITRKGTDKIVKLYDFKLINSTFNANKRFLNKLDFKDAATKQKLAGIVEEFSKEWKNITKPLGRTFWGVLAAGALAFIGINIWATKAQIHGSRIGRYEARKKLENEKYFVKYTDEQIAQAKENLKNKPKEKRGLFSFGKKDNMESKGWWRNMWTIATKSGEYKRWKKSDTDESKLVTRELTPEEIAKAKADQEVIQRVVKKINNKAEEYSENMETAASTVLLSSYLGGGLIGGAFSWFLTKTGLAEKYNKARIKKFAGDEGVKCFDEIVKFESKKRGVFSKIAFCFKENGPVNRIKELTLDNLTKANPKGKIINPLKAFGTSLMSLKFSRNIMITFASAALTGFAGLLLSLKLQKDSARAGRYAAKQELLNDPRNFISHSEKDLESVKDIKAKKKTMGEKIKEYLLFVPTSIKHSLAYHKYKKTKLKETRELKEELMKLDVSEKQLKEAKNLQRKLFNTFEKVDDKSQEYSETMEVINEVGQSALSHVPNVVLIGLPILGLVGIASGKVTIMGFGKKIINTLSSISWILKTKLAKKHVSQINDNLVNLINETNAPNTWVDLKNAIVPKSADIEGVYRGTNDDSALPALLKILGLSEQQTKNLFQKLDIMDDYEKIADMKPAELIKFAKKLPKDHPLKKVLVYKRFISSVKLDNNDINLILDIKNKLSEIENIDELLKRIDIDFKLNISINDRMADFDIGKILKIGIEKLPTEKLNELLDSVKSLNENSIKTLEGRRLGDIIKDIDSFPISASQKDCIRKIYNFVDRSIDEIRKDVISTPKIGEVFRSITNSRPSMLLSSAINSKTLTNYLRKLVENMPEEKIKALNSKLDDACMNIGNVFELGSVSKTELLDSITKLEKIINNLPEDEIKKITDTYVKLISENPKKFIYLVTKEPKKLLATMNTPVLQNTMMALGVGTAVGTVGLTYAIASVLAKLQKDAGRYGVMQAMNELEDYRYYADIGTIADENKQVQSSEKQINKQQITTNQADYFKKFISNKKNSSK